MSLASTLRMIRPGTTALFLLLVALASQAAPVQPVGSIAGNYIRSDFTVEDGLPDNVVNAVMRADNGLLWIGTESGLATFDGREFRRIRLSFPGTPSQGAVRAFAKAANGDLWVGTNVGMVLVPRQSLDQLTPVVTTFIPLGGPQSDEVEALLVTREGVLWAGTNHGLYRRESGRFTKVLRSGSFSRLAEAPNGHLLIVSGRGFLELDGQKIIEHFGLARRLHVRDDEIFNVFEDHSGTMWFSTPKGVVREGEHPFASFRPAAAAHAAAFRVYEDPQRSIWISTNQGTYRAKGDDLELLAAGVGARCLYATPEGDLWIGTNGAGLIHFKPRLIHMFTKADGLQSDIVMAVLPAHDGKLWVGGNCGLSSFDGVGFKTYSEKEGLANTCVWSLAEDHNHELWVGSYGGGLFQLHDGRFTQFSIPEGLVSRIVLQIVVARDNSLWIATPEGLSHLQQGSFTNFTTAQGLSSNRVLGVFQDHTGTIWVASQGGIDRLTETGFKHLQSPWPEEGTSAIRFAEDSMGDLYAANSSKGIGLIKDNLLTVAEDDLNVMDMVESPNHDLWFSSKNGVIRVALNDLRRAFTEHLVPLNYGQLDRADGLNSTQSSVGAPNIAITPDHRLWIATVKGLAMLDLDQLPTNVHQPKVFLGGVTVERKKQPAGSRLVLPAGTNHVELHLSAVDLASPEKIRIQYRLDGVDSDWLDADVSRTAVYTTIPVGSHTFHVRATGADGKWDRAGIVYQVTQEPFVYQKKWFQLACAAFFIVLLSVIYLARVRQIIRQTRILLETRIAERERIARDLHDTFLQGVQGILLRFHTSTQQLPIDEPLRRVFEGVLDQSDEVLLQGRGLLSDLRMTESETGELPVTLAMAGREFRTPGAAAHKVIVTGETRCLNPVVYDEILKIGREAIFNSFRHAAATTIETELNYSSSDLRIRFRDDGKGIGHDVLADGNRAGHYGLPGMRERAAKIGARLEIYSRSGAGTEVDLKVPATIAYHQAARPRVNWLHRLFGEELL